MPDEWGNPYEPGTPEYDQFVKGMMRAVTIPTTSAAAGLDSLREFPQADVNPTTFEKYIPGLVSRVGGGMASGLMSADQLYDWATRKPFRMALDKLGIMKDDYQLPQAPKFLTRLEELGASSRRKAEDVIGVVKPEEDNIPEQVLSDVGDIAGQMAVPIPGSAMKMLPLGIQKFVNPIAHVIAPLATEHKFLPFGIAGGVTAGSDALIAGAPAIDDAISSAKDAITSGAQTVYQKVTGQEPQPPEPQPLRPSDYPLPTPPIPPAKPPTLGIQPQAQAAAPQQPQLGIQPPAAQDTTTDPQDLTPQTGESGMSLPLAIGGLVGLGTFLGGVRGARRGLTRAGVHGLSEVPDMGPGSSYAAKKQAFEQSAQFQRNPTPDMTKQPQAPLAVRPIDIPGLKVQTAVQDETALARAHFENSAQLNNDVAQILGDVKNSQAQQTRVESFFETGWHPSSGTQNIPLQETGLKYGRLNNEGKNIVQRALYAGDEMEYRDKANRPLEAASQPRDPALRRRLGETDDVTLKKWISDGLRDPDAGPVIRDVWQQTGPLNMEILRREGYPVADIERISNDHARYLPTPGPDQRPMHVLSERIDEPHSGAPIPTTSAMDLFQQHQDALLKRIENDKLNRALIDSDAYAQRMDPNYAGMFTKSVDANGNRVTPVDRDSVTIPRPGGWETYIPNNDHIGMVMKASPVVKRGILAAQRNWFTKLTTGPLAAAGGKFFGATHGWLRGPYLAQINAAPDSNATITNMLYHKMGGKGRIGNFMTRLVPDLYAAAPVMTAKVLADRSVHAVSNLLMPDARQWKNPAHYPNMILRKTLGDARVGRMRRSLINYYNNSLTAEMRSVGVSGSGNYGAALAPSYLRSADLNDMITHNPGAILAPRSITARSPFGKRMPLSVNLNNLIHEVFGAFMDAPNMAHYVINRGNPNFSPARLVNEARAIVGDPGKVGRNMGALNRNLAYTNAAVQDVARSLRAQTEAPMARLLTRSILLGGAAGASLYTAMHTPGGLSHLLNLISTGQASSPVIYNGKDTDSTMIWSLPQTDRYAYPLHLDVLAHAVGAYEAHKSEPAFERMYHMLSDMFSQHVWHNTIEASKHGASQIIDPLINLPPGIAGAVEAFGVHPRIEADRLIDRALRGRPFELGSSYRPKGSPGEEADSSMLGDRMEHTLAGLYGLGSNMLETLERGYHSYKQGEHGFMPVHRMLDNFAQHWMDQNPYGNDLLWSTNTRLSTNSPLAEANYKALDVMRDTTGAKSDVQYEGYTRKGGEHLSAMGDKKFSRDPTIESMRLLTSTTLNGINKRYMPHINDLYKLDRDLNNMPMDESVRREKHNQYMRDINTRHIAIANDIAQLNERLSRMAGRPIDIASGQIDWKRGADQFKR